jgi:hypothetical protein
MTFYRYENENRSTYVESPSGSERFYSTVHLSLKEYNLHKETPKGYWIGYGEMLEGKLRGRSRWVSKTSKKRFAYPTKELALESFVYRKKYQLDILKRQVADLEYVLELAKKENKTQHI